MSVRADGGSVAGLAALLIGLCLSVRYHGALAWFWLGSSFFGAAILLCWHFVRQVQPPSFRNAYTGRLDRQKLAKFAAELVTPRRKEPAVVVVLDCDGLGEVNARYGREAGDHVLSILGRILHHETRSTDALVRTGDDEFALVLRAASSIEAKRILDRIQESFEKQVFDAGYECLISMDVSEPDVAEDENLLAKTDWALCHSQLGKQNGPYTS